MFRSGVDAERRSVSAFFDWKAPTWRQYAGSLGALGVGIYALTQSVFVFGLALLVSGAAALSHAVYKARRFPDVLTRFRNVKRKDFTAVLERSYRETGMDLASLVDFDPKDLPLFEPRCANPADRNLIEALRRKSVFLWGYNASGDALPESYRFIRKDGRVFAEFSPVTISIVYLTRHKVLIYNAILDLKTGDLPVGSMRELFLKDIVEVTVTVTARRVTEKENADLLKRYRSAVKSNDEDVVVRQHFARLTKRDGLPLELPIGMPTCQSGKTGTLYAVDDADQDRFRRVIRQISKRIDDAKVAA